MDRGMLISELAKLIGVSEDTVTNWELRGRKPRGKSLERLREILVL